MPPRKRATTPVKAVRKIDTTIYSVMLSGTAFEAGVDTKFPIKPTSKRKRGFGYQVKFDLGVPDLRKLTDLMAELAMDADDAREIATREAIYKDMDKFPAAAGL